MRNSRFYLPRESESLEGAGQSRDLENTPGPYVQPWYVPASQGFYAALGVLKRAMAASQRLAMVAPSCLLAGSAATLTPGQRPRELLQ